MFLHKVPLKTSEVFIPVLFDSSKLNYITTNAVI